MISTSQTPNAGQPGVIPFEGLRAPQNEQGTAQQPAPNGLPVPVLREADGNPYEFRDIKFDSNTGEISALAAMSCHVAAILPGPEDFQKIILIQYHKDSPDEYRVESVVKEEHLERLPMATTMKGDKFAYVTTENGEDVLKIVADSMEFFHKPIILSEISEDFHGITDIDFTPDGKAIIAVNARGGLYTYWLDGEKPKGLALVAPRYRENVVPEDPFTTIRFSEDGHTLRLEGKTHALEGRVEIDQQKISIVDLHVVP